MESLENLEFDTILDICGVGAFSISLGERSIASSLISFYCRSSFDVFDSGEDKNWVAGLNEACDVNGNCFNLKEPTFEPMALDNYSFIGTLRLTLLAPIILNVGDNYSIFWLYDGPNTV